MRLQFLRGPAAFAELELAPVVPSSGLVMLGVDDDADLEVLRHRAADAGVQEAIPTSGDRGRVARYLDPDGRLVIVQVFRRDRRFHD